MRPITGLTTHIYLSALSAPLHHLPHLATLSFSIALDTTAQVCKSCGEAYVDEKVASELLTSAEAAAKAGAKVEIREYVTA
jgi:hypothetical protein